MFHVGHRIRTTSDIRVPILPLRARQGNVHMGKHIDNGVALNSSDFKDIWDYYATNATIKACVNILRAALFSGELGYDGDVAMDHTTQKMYRNLMERALDWALVVGVIPVTSKVVTQSDGTISKFPCIPEPGVMTIKVKIDETTGECAYMAVRNTGHRSQLLRVGRQGKRNVMVWNTGQSPPGIDGEIKTDLNPLFRRDKYVQQHRRYQTIAAAKLCNPPLHTESKGPSKVDGTGFNWGQHPNTFEGAEVERLTTNDQIADRQIAAKRGGGTHTNWPVSMVGHVGDWEHESVEVPISSNRNVVRVQPPEGPSGLSQMETEAREECLRIFGIPESLFNSTGRASLGHLQVFAFNSSIKRWHRVMRDFINGAVLACNPESALPVITCFPCTELSVLTKMHDADAIDDSLYKKILYHNLGLDMVTDSPATDTVGIKRQRR